MRAEIGHLVHVHDQHHAFEYEGIFVEEESHDVKVVFYGTITVIITKVVKESNPGQAKVGDRKTFPTPRYVPVFIRQLTESEQLLYVQS